MSQVLVIGATGLIGSHIAALLVADGHRVVGAARDIEGATYRMPAIEWRRIDLARASAADWVELLASVDAVVNCAGALQDSLGDDLQATHASGLQALFDACRALGGRRVVHFSAMGVDRATPTAFSRTKSAGEAMLMRYDDLDWVILRPSVVLGTAVYGASALIRGLAALPILPVMPDTAPIQPVALTDVAAAAAFFADAKAPSRVALELAGPDAMTFVEVVRLYRGWLGHAPAREFTLPGWAAGLLYRLGDAASWLGWRPPVRSTAQREIARGAVGDPSQWRQLTGREPQSIAAMLAANPASVQERWFANFYPVKPFVLVCLVLFWTGSGVASLGPGYRPGLSLMELAGAGAVAPLIITGGGLADILVGIGIALRRTAAPALLAGIVVSLLYAAAGTLLTPWLWFDPLAPLLKIGPIIGLHLAALATLQDR